MASPKAAASKSFRVNASVGKRVLQAANFNSYLGRAHYTGATSSADGSGQNPGRGFEESKVVIETTIPANKQIKLSLGFAHYVAFCAADDPARVNAHAASAVVALTNSTFEEFKAIGMKSGGVELTKVETGVNPVTFRQAVALASPYAGLDPSISDMFVEDEWQSILEFSELVLGGGGSEADSCVYLLAYGLLKNIGMNSRYTQEGFESLRTPIDQVRQFSAEKVIPYLRQKINY